MSIDLKEYRKFIVTALNVIAVVIELGLTHGALLHALVAVSAIATAAGVVTVRNGTVPPKTPN